MGRSRLYAGMVAIAHPPATIRHLRLSPCCLGGVMVWWGFTLLLVTRELLAKGSRLGWNLIAISLGAGFIPDTTYSLLSGYWQNAVFNIVFLALFATPLWAIHHHIRDDA